MKKYLYEARSPLILAKEAHKARLREPIRSKPVDITVDGFIEAVLGTGIPGQIVGEEPEVVHMDFDSLLTPAGALEPAFKAN